MAIISIRAVMAAAIGLATLVPADAIVGQARESRASSVVMVLSRSGERAGFCSGVVLAPRIVLTAAHCVSAASDTRIHFKDDAGAPVFLDAAQVARHPDYRADAAAKRLRSVDLAVIVMSRDLPDRFAPARLGSGSDSVGAGFTLAGFGFAFENAPRSGGTLREGAVTLRAPVSKLLLWLVGGSGACTGDSGGSVFAPDGTLVGIIAFAEGTGERKCGALTQAIRVAPFATWIKANSE